uniref:Conotoxin SmIVB n=2 Tax=Conus stercusmuscarum TaxID=89452 RepID=CA4B_CONSE|nr:RecName: Full=Conotoxin SmIVB; Flags: Precursor [Conus stercusmuscarum]
MGMRMMFTVFLLVVLATTVVSIPSDRASDGRNAEVNERAPWLVPSTITTCCGYDPGSMCPPCMCNNTCKPKPKKSGRRNH